MGTDILSLKVGPITIPTLMHVMSGPLSYNLLLGRPWLHALGVVSSTLHGSLKFVANNQVVTVKVDPEAMQLCQIVAVGQASVTPSFQNFVPTLSSSIVTYAFVSSPKKEEHKKEEITKEVVKKERSPKKQDSSKEKSPKVDTPKVKMLESTPKKPSPAKSPSLSKVNVCLGDDWVSLDFSDSDVGEYKVDPIHLRFPKISFTTTMKDDYASIKPGDAYHVDHLFYTKPPSFKELQNIYGLGYKLVSQLGYDGKGCGPNEKGIWIPLEPKPRHHNTGLGYCHMGRKAKPWLAVNMISADPLPLKFFHPKLIDACISPNEIPLDLFPSKESLKEFLGAYDGMPSYHHKCQFPYCLNAQAYFGGSVLQGTPLSHTGEQMSIPHPEDRNALFSGEKMTSS